MINLLNAESPAIAGDGFRSLVEQAALGIEQVSLDDRLLEVNPALATMLGYEPAELRGRPVSDITHPDYMTETTDLTGQLVDGTIPSFTVEKRYLRKGGHAIWVKVTASLAREANGAPAYRIAIVEDIDQPETRRSTTTGRRGEIPRDG